MQSTELEPVVLDLLALIGENRWEDDFNKAIANAQAQNIPELYDIQNLDDYIQYINRLLTWVPHEDHAAQEILRRLTKLYFILDQPPLRSLQNRILPRAEQPPLTPLSRWLVNYAKALGAFLDTPGSLTPESLQTFYESPNYNMNEYIRPNGDWTTFNQFFARNFKPGYRPIAAVSDSSVIVSPADSTFVGQWEIRKDSHVTVKELHWQVRELLGDSPFRDRFKNGIFMHSFLNVTDYHRLHTPVGGKVVEAREIMGQAYLEVAAETIPGDVGGAKRLRVVRHLEVQDNTGYQFGQARGLVVIDSPIGLVAVLPIGMAQVASVILTAEEGVTLRKGEEIGYFQFGGSDIVVLFELASNVSIGAQPNVHYKMGTRIAQAFPVLG